MISGAPFSATLRPASRTRSATVDDARTREVRHKHFGHAVALGPNWLSIASSRNERLAWTNAACHSAEDIALNGTSATEAPHRTMSGSRSLIRARLFLSSDVSPSSNTTA